MVQALPEKQAAVSVAPTSVSEPPEYDLPDGSMSASDDAKLHDPAPSAETARQHAAGEGDSNDSVEQTEYPPLWKTLLIVSGLFLGVFLVALDQTIIGTAIPKITDEFKTIKVRRNPPRRRPLDTLWLWSRPLGNVGLTTPDSALTL